MRCGNRWYHSASASVSPVRMRMACSIEVTKTLPSPICPVLAALPMASTTRSTSLVATATSTRIFGRKVHRVFGAAIDLGMALLPAIALDLGDGHAVHADGQQRVAHVFELERLDDRDDELHGGLLARSRETGGVGSRLLHCAEDMNGRSATSSIRFRAIACRRISRRQYRTSCAWRRSAIAAPGRAAIVEVCASRRIGATSICAARFVRRDVLFAVVDVALASLDIGLLRGQRLLAIVDRPRSAPADRVRALETKGRA